MSLFARGTTISRLRLRGVPPDPFAARMRLSSALGAMDLSPAGLPMGAIILIRALQDPLPGRLQLKHGGHMPPPVWREAVARRIEALTRTAARPADGFVSNNAEAVYFADRGELLACLARDWCAGAIGARWWWRSLLRDSDSVRAVLAEWLRSPEYAPAALQQLACTGEAASFVQRLNDESVHALLERVIERFGLTNLRMPVNDGESTSANIHYEPRRALKSPWLQWVPEASQAGLTRKQANLLGVALLLHRAPGVARSAALAKAVHRWMASVKSQISEVQRYDNMPIPVVVSYDDDIPDRWPKNATPRTLRDSESTEAESSNALPARVEEGDRGGIDNRVGQKSDDVPKAKQPLPRDGRAVTAPAMLPPSGEKPSLTAAIPREMPPGPRTPALGSMPSHQLLPAVSGAPWVETRYGGALYLINLALFLDLYGDFSSPARPGIELPIWDFIALLGEALIGRAIHRDPLWPLLAQLAGRHVDDPLGADYTPADEWRMPEPWIAPYSESGDWRWSVKQRRLQVWHPGGFAVLDIPTRGRDPQAILADELAPYRASGLCPGIAHRHAPVKSKRTTRISPGNPALRRWLSWLLPYVHARLKTALGTAPTVDAGRLVCAGRARLQVTATHLDAHFTLADLPIEVRLAGLDRDPGWVPAAGRYVRFHFD